MTASNEQTEHQKWLHAVNREDAHRAHDKLDDFHGRVIDSAIRSGQSALRAAMLINGGAAVSLLTFIGTLPANQKHSVANTLVWFASGVALAVVAIAFSYFTDYFLAEVVASKIRMFDYPYSKPGPTTAKCRCLNIVFHALTIIVGLASVGAFVGGLLDVRNALSVIG